MAFGTTAPPRRGRRGLHSASQRLPFSAVASAARRAGGAPPCDTEHGGERDSRAARGRRHGVASRHAALGRFVVVLVVRRTSAHRCMRRESVAKLLRCSPLRSGPSGFQLRIRTRRADTRTAADAGKWPGSLGNVVVVEAAALMPLVRNLVWLSAVAALAPNSASRWRTHPFSHTNAH